TYKLYTIPAYFMSSETLIEYVKIMQNYQEISVFTIVNWFLVLQGITYMILTIRLVQKYSLQMRDTFSSLEKINLRWLRNITVLATIVWFIVFMEILYLTIYTEKPLEFNLIGIATSIYIYTLGYIGLFKSEIFSQKYVTYSLSHMMDTRENLLPESGTATLKSEREFDKTKGKKYTKSGLSDDKAKESLARLQSLMEKEKTYLNNNLTLHQLAEELSISPHNLSEIINKFLNKNFFDYVNYFRIEEVKQKLQDPNKQILTLLSIAYDAGFNSKSGFNAIFKRSMKLTPSEYREKISKA
ncbi:MAG: helix-turn-helix transcriptional regulator, partial [Calditrichia bacterium]|nr:helix-turn-helix transcriptional regulator [Calditrichia bacterium]